MSLQETLTCVRENIPAMAVVFNNGQWGAEKKNQVDFYDRRFVGAVLELKANLPSWRAPWARRGSRSKRRRRGWPALHAACKAQSEGKTTVLEMMVSQELGDPFRRDALKQPVRHLAKYRASGGRGSCASGALQGRSSCQIRPAGSASR